MGTFMDVEEGAKTVPSTMLYKIKLGIIINKPNTNVIDHIVQAILP